MSDNISIGEQQLQTDFGIENPLDFKERGDMLNVVDPVKVSERYMKHQVESVVKRLLEGEFDGSPSIIEDVEKTLVESLGVSSVDSLLYLALHSNQPSAVSIVNAYQQTIKQVRNQYATYLTVELSKIFAKKAMDEAFRSMIERKPRRSEDSASDTSDASVKETVEHMVASLEQVKIEPKEEQPDVQPDVQPDTNIKVMQKSSWATTSESSADCSNEEIRHSILSKLNIAPPISTKNSFDALDDANKTTAMLATKVKKETDAQQKRVAELVKQTGVANQTGFTWAKPQSHTPNQAYVNEVPSHALTRVSSDTTVSRAFYANQPSRELPYSITGGKDVENGVKSNYVPRGMVRSATHTYSSTHKRTGIPPSFNHKKLKTRTSGNFLFNPKNPYFSEEDDAFLHETDEHGEPIGWIVSEFGGKLWFSARINDDLYHHHDRETDTWEHVLQVEKNGHFVLEQKDTKFAIEYYAPKRK